MKETILFQSGMYGYSDCVDADADTHANTDIDAVADVENDLLQSILQGIQAVFEPCILVGTVGRWNGKFVGYRYCQCYSVFENAISGYDDIIIKQIGTRLHFTLIHHDGRHEMELRRFNDCALNDPNRDCFQGFSDSTLNYINRNTNNFGKVSY